MKSAKTLTTVFPLGSCLLATRSAEPSGAQAPLSTTDRLSEVEVLSIVHDLNENIFQVTVNRGMGETGSTAPERARQIKFVNENWEM